MDTQPLRTSVIGSYPFPGWLEFFSSHLDQFGSNDIAEMQDDAVIAAIHDQTTAGLDKETLLPILAANPDIALIIPEANRTFVAERLECDPARPTGMNDRDTLDLAKRTGMKMLVPHHYDMFSFNTADPADFAAEAARRDQPATVLQNGERITLKRPS